jgi:hypothetical protein
METKTKKNEKPVCSFCKLPITEDHIVTKMVGCTLPPVEVKQVPVPDTRYRKKIEHPSEGSLVLYRNTPNTRNMLAYDVGDLDDNDFERKFGHETPYHRSCYDVISAKNFALRIGKYQRRFKWRLRKELEKQQQ